MFGINKNKFNKTVKNQNIQEGPCIFPFKHKWKTHEKCFETEKGPICATVVNENKTLKKYGFCVNIPPSKKKKLNSNSQDSNLKVNSPPNIKMPNLPDPPYNSAFIQQLTLLENIMYKNGSPMRALAYKKAKTTIIGLSRTPINSIEDIKGLPNIGDSIIEKLSQFINTGQIKQLINENSNSIIHDSLTKIYGVGPKHADKLIKAGITSIAALREKDELLNSKQKIGLEYYDDLNLRIPRNEIDEYNSIFEYYFNIAKQKTSSSKAHYEIVGSYRRVSPDSGDIDVIITHPTNKKDVFTQFIKLLTENNIILHKLTDGDKQIKILVVCQLPDRPARRVDFMYSPPNEYPLAILYFTGSQLFNTAMRQHALDIGFTMNEHRIQNLKTKKNLSGMESEEDVFKILGLEYVEPQNRIDQTSLKYIIDSNEQFIKNFKQQGIIFLESQSEKTLIEFIKHANHLYHTIGSPIITDDEYDIIREYIITKYPESDIENLIGAPVIENAKNKVTLPYDMPSMDKIKPTTNALSKWLSKYKSPSQYVLSMKLDGVSGLYDTQAQKLYTRGNGKIGQDISYLIPYFKLPKNMELVIRGEFIISKENFGHFENKANPRNTVAGIINSKTTDPTYIQYVDFIAYEVLKPILKPSEQFKLLSEIYPDYTCKYDITSSITNDTLSSTLQSWRDTSDYEMDGIVVYHDKVYKRESGNPKHAFAFKMVLTDQKAEAKVTNIIWTPSKDGYLKPRVQIEPVNVSGVTITYATGFNAAFIEKNNINIGSVIEILRSGDVIPYINRVIKPSSKPHMPDLDYLWNDTHIDIMLKSKEDNIDVVTKNIFGFFNDIEGLGPGNIKKIVNAEYNTIPKILAMTKADLLAIDGFKDKLATKIHTNIQEKIANMSLLDIISDSNVFGRGFGHKKVALILNTYPDIITSNEDNTTKINKLSDIKGLALKTSENFVNKIPNFIDFITIAKLNDKLIYIPHQQQPIKIGEQTHPLYNKYIVFTGIRNKELETKITSIGGIISDKIKKDTFLLVTSDMDSTSSKMSDAKKNNTQIITLDEFTTQYTFI